ncbi:MAG: hypothetical protein RL339_2266 [Pseudomonadota bacterium]
MLGKCTDSIVHRSWRKDDGHLLSDTWKPIINLTWSNIIAQSNGTNTKQRGQLKALQVFKKCAHSIKGVGHFSNLGALSNAATRADKFDYGDRLRNYGRLR